MKAASLKDNVSGFLTYKQSLGYVYESQGQMLSKYADFAMTRTTAAVPVKEVTNEYLSSLAVTPGSLYQAVCVLREFSRYLHARGFHEAYMIPPKTASQPVPEDPYFFTEKEIERFFEQVDTIQPNKSFKGREIVLPALFRMLYCCGMRCIEIRRLLCEDVHTDECYIDVINSKGPKSRRIFISQELADYLADYNKRISNIIPDRKYFFQIRSQACSENFICNNFRRLWLKAFPEFKKTSRPRAYDFRHHFAWANLNRWASDGLDVNVMLPYLMRYMGHKNVSETLYYFHFVPEFFSTYKDMTSDLDDIIPEVPDEE